MTFRDRAGLVLGAANKSKNLLVVCTAFVCAIVLNTVGDVRLECSICSAYESVQRGAELGDMVLSKNVFIGYPAPNVELLSVRPSKGGRLSLEVPAENIGLLFEDHSHSLWRSFWREADRRISLSFSHKYLFGRLVRQYLSVVISYRFQGWRSAIVFDGGICPPIVRRLFASSRLILPERDERPLHGHESFSIDLIGTNHLRELARVNYRNIDGDQDRGKFNSNLPPWRAVGLAVAGVFIAGWGWLNLRHGRETFWTFWGFVVGCLLWLCSIDGWLNWAIGR